MEVVKNNPDLFLLHNYEDYLTPTFLLPLAHGNSVFFLLTRWHGKQAVTVSISHLLIDRKNLTALILCPDDGCWLQGKSLFYTL